MSDFEVITDRDGSYDNYPRGSRYRFNSTGCWSPSLLRAIGARTPRLGLRIEQKEQPPPAPPEMARVPSPVR